MAFVGLPSRKERKAATVSGGKGCLAGCLFLVSMLATVAVGGSVSNAKEPGRKAGQFGNPQSRSHRGQAEEVPILAGQSAKRPVAGLGCFVNEGQLFRAERLPIVPAVQLPVPAFQMGQRVVAGSPVLDQPAAELLDGSQVEIRGLNAHPLAQSLHQCFHRRTGKP